MTAKRDQDIAIVGLGALFPGSTDVGGFWRDVLAGTDLITDVPATHWLIEDYYDPDPSAPDKTYGKRGAFLPTVPFDPVHFAIPPSNLSSTDTSQLLALIVAQQVLDDAARGDFASLDRDRVSVILGVASTTELVVELGSRLQRPIWEKALRRQGYPEDEVQAACDRISDSYVPWTESSFPGLLGNVVAGRIANRFDLGGTNCVVDAACASSLSALHLALLELRSRTSDLVIAGGVDTLNDILMYECFSKTPALSPTGDARPFSADADGTILGEGIGMIALKRLADAQQAGDRIYAVVKGLGTSSDGRSKSIYAPVSAGQAKALRRAYEDAGYGPESVGLVEAHGTATRAGDAAEFEALQAVFSEADPERIGRTALGSVKSQIGHTKAAAGVAGLMKAVLALHHRVLPPTIKVDRPNPNLALAESPFYLNTEARPWISAQDHPRRASVSSFGFGGSNYHVTLEEAPEARDSTARIRTFPTELVLVGAPSAEALAEECRELAAQIEPESLRYWAHATQTEAAEKGGDHRLAIAAASEDELRTLLGKAAEAIAANPGRSFTWPSGVSYGSGTLSGGVALLFPGQGSQRLGMGGGAAMAFDRARAIWDAFANLSFEGVSERLHEVVFPVPAFGVEDRAAQQARLTATEWAQPALAAVSLSYLALLRAVGFAPDFTGGHSFGELTALCAAGAFGGPELLRAARRRGELMAAASAIPGAMVAVTGKIEGLAARIATSGIEVVAANQNGPHQVVYSGATEAVEALEALLAGASGIRVTRLPVSTAFHSPLVEGSVASFREFLAGLPFHETYIPVHANSTAGVYPSDPDEARDLLASQLARPVRFGDQIEAMYEAGARIFVEVGPGSALTGMVERILQGRPHTAVAVERKGLDFATGLWQLLGRLWTDGVPLRPVALWEEYAIPSDPRLSPKAAFTVPINGANYGKPYPPPGGAAALPPPNPPRPSRESPVPEPVGAHPVKEAASEMSTLPHAPHSDPPGAAALQAVVEMHRETAAAHTAYITSMAETHQAYLTAMAAAIGSFGGEVSSDLVAASTAPLASSVHPVQVGTPAHAAPVARIPTPPPRVATPAVAVPVAPAAPAPAAAAPSAPAAGAGLSLVDLLLGVVADKTGYPVEMLGLDLELEAGLGIDSIKRVEILSALREQAPDLPEVEPSQLASLRTLQEIIDFMGRGAPSTHGGGPSRNGTSGGVSSSASTPAPMDVTAPSGGRSPSALTSLLLQIVADKTGYPVEMLGLDLELEAGLGIDSIKRVEILSALREQAPDLPEVEPSQLASLRTLQEIIGFMGRGAPSAEASDGSRNGTGPSADDHSAGTAAPAAAPGTVESVERFVVRAVPAPRAGLALPGLLGGPGPIAIVRDRRGIAPLLAERLGAYGVSTLCVDSVPVEATGVIHLGGLDTPADDEAALALNHSAFAAARAVSERLSIEGGVFVTVQDTGGDFGLAGVQDARLWTAGLPGLVKSAAREWPMAAVKAIDLASGGRDPGELADDLVDELLFGGPEVEVGRTLSGRFTLVAELEPADRKPAAELGPDDVLLVTGGARGITATCLMALAAAHGPRMVLLGRTPIETESADLAGATGTPALREVLIARASASGKKVLPAEIERSLAAILAGREVVETLRSLEAAGSATRYLSCDVTDVEALSSLLDEVRRDWGPITGLVHAAGVLADRRITEKTDEQFRSVLGVKVGGLRALASVTAKDPLRHILLFSSVAARVGNAGQCDYAMANEILNRWAAAEAVRRPDCLVRSIGWGPWDGGMVTPALRGHFEARGVALIPPTAGAAAFVEEFAIATPPEVVIGVGSPTRALAGEAGRTWVMDVLVNDRTYPVLTSHRVRDVPVLPVVLVVEWLARAARACFPGKPLPRISDVRVLRGVRLEGFANGGNRLVIHLAESVEEDRTSLRMELRSPDGALHYSAIAEFLPETPEPMFGELSLALEEASWEASDLYGEQLFHGPDFQAIRSLEGISEEGAEAILVGTRALGWNGAWQTDVVALDGALQVARIWGMHRFGRPSLPTRIGSITLYQERPTDEPIRCVVRMGTAGELKTVSDIALVTESGRVVAELRGVEMHLFQGEAVAE